MRPTYPLSRLPALLLALVVLTPIALAAESRQTIAAGEEVEGKVVGVTDGDTLTLLVGSTQYKVRLSGIDAPESGQPFGTQAKKTLSDKVFGKTVKVLSQGSDKYGRTLGVVYADGCVNTAMVKEGFAWHYKEYSDNKTLARSEEEARAAKAGLWADAHPIPPWDWRHKPSTALVPAPSTALVPAPKQSTAIVPTDKQEQTVYVTKTGSKYHTAGCRYLAKSSTPIPLSEAKKRYTPCSVCGAGSLGAEETEPRQDPPTSFSSPPSNSSGDRVQVRGYYRKDGTYVRPHTRSRPSK